MGLKNYNGVPVGQQQLFTLDTNGNPVPVGPNHPLVTQLAGSILQEQKTQADAVGGALTFSTTLTEVEIYNRDTVDGTFTVNGIALLVPAGDAFQAKIGGVPGNTVAVSGSSTYVVGRYS